MSLSVPVVFLVLPITVVFDSGSTHLLRTIAGIRLDASGQADERERRAMIARIAVWKPMPDDDRQWVIDAAKTVPGVLDAYHLIDPQTGDGLSIAFFEDTVRRG